VNQPTSLALRLVYGLVLTGAALPFGLAGSSWVGLVVGGVGLGLVPSFGPLVLIALALYRIVLVARNPHTLDVPRAAGLARVLRIVGIVLMYVGALAAVVSWIMRPLMQWLIPERTDLGVEFFTELYLYMIGGVGLLGLALFEFSRLLAFERQAGHAAHTAAEHGSA
jgi:hypothetical protein